MEITQELINSCLSFADLTRRLGKNPHNRLTQKLKNELMQKNISFGHFTKNGVTPQPLIEKICPICGEPFTPKYRKDQMTCSYSCSNTYFARKRNKPENYKSYKKICFHHYPKKCAICEENKVVEVHHMDGNHKNNDIKNLVPLCPTHHQYWHSRYRNLIREKIELFLSKSLPINER